MKTFKNIKRNIFIAGMAALTLTACDTVDFGDINNDPNNPSNPSSGSLLTNGLRNFGPYVSSTTPMLYVQYLSNGQYPDESRYITMNFSYDAIYTGVLTDLQAVVNLNMESDATSAPNNIAAAKLGQAYFFQLAADRWGYVPFSQSLQGLDNVTPAFDSQEDVYRGVIAMIDDALGMIDTSVSGAEGDILFNGDMDRWIQFGNTLKANAAMRMAKRDGDMGGFARTAFNQAIGNAIMDDADNIYYTFLSDDNNDNPWQDRFETRKDYIASDRVIDFLVGSGTSTAPEDPRTSKFFDPVVGSTEFIGAPYGEDNSNVDAFSFITENIIYDGTAPGIIFTAAQMQFAKAEAIERGWMTGDAEAAWKMGIQESMDQWGVDAADATAFIDAQVYAGMQSIAEQKWVAMYMQGYESWSEFRRIGGPASIVIDPADVYNGATGIPQRMAYGTNTPASNGEAYDAAVAAQGADDFNTVLWWAK